MRELSLNILDVALNSVEAGSSELRIKISESKSKMKVSIRDNGRGMRRDERSNATDPFYSSKDHAEVGLGLPLMKMAAERTGGRFAIFSRVGRGTLVKALFLTDSIDFIPLGDIASTLICLLEANPDVRLRFSHKGGKFLARLDSKFLEKSCEDPRRDRLVYAKNYLESKYQERT